MWKPTRYNLGKAKPDGTELRYVQVMTRKGPRSTAKWIDYLDCPLLEFRLLVLGDDLIGQDTLQAIFDYGGVHALGQERSQGWGRYRSEMWQVEAEKCAEVS